MQDWRHHQILGPNSALAETLGNYDEAVFLELAVRVVRPMRESP